MDNWDKNIITNENLNKLGGIKHFTSTKQSISITCPRFTGDSPKIYSNARKKLGNVLGIDPHYLVFPRQTHSNNIEIIHQVPKEEIKNVDAMITNVPGICLCIQTADCVPILLFDPVKKVIAVVHAGWRGTVRKILFHTVKRMNKEFRCKPENIVVTIGPSISQRKYEIGKEVIYEIKKIMDNPDLVLIYRKKSEKAYLDLWEANRLQLLEGGLSNENIYVSSICTFTDSDHFFSARRQGIETGRIVTGIILKDE